MNVRQLATRGAALSAAATAIAATVALSGVGVANAATPSSTPSSAPSPAPTATASPVPAPQCDPLPDYVKGKPAQLHVLGAKGAYIWHDNDGWHVRVTHSSDSTMVFTGTVVATAPITYTRVVDESQDVVTTSPDRQVLTFRLVNHGLTDGFDFRDQCATGLAVNLRIDGSQAPRDDVFIGAHDSRALTNPWIVLRLPRS